MGGTNCVVLQELCMAGLWTRDGISRTIWDATLSGSVCSGGGGGVQETWAALSLSCCKGFGKARRAETDGLGTWSFGQYL